MTATIVMRTSRGLLVRNPTESNIQAVLESLPRDGHIILEVAGEPELNAHYVQVWLRSNGLYQLEYREGGAGEHYQALTVSREKVCEALSEWNQGGSSWRENFSWKSIGEWFT